MQQREQFGGGAQAVPTFGARWDPVTKMRPAELMLLNPAALELVKATL